MTDQPLDPRRAAPDFDLDMLASVLDGDPNSSEGGYLDLRTGQTWPAFVFEEDDDFDPEDPRRRYVACEGSRGAWQDMRDFIETQVPDPDLSGRLATAITGRGAFRRFSTVLSDHDEVRYAWLRFRDERARERARSWLVEAGLLPSS